MMSSSESRTHNVAKNAVLSLICQVVAVILAFVSRTAFIHILGKDYLGVSGLYTNILTILSFAELGIGNAMVYSMYKPLANNDSEKLKSLMALYKKAYQIIGIIVAVSGICVIPFMGYIIRSKPNIPDNLTIIYLLYLFNTVSSYFFVYKRSIITADQKLYIINIYQQITNIAQIIVQVLVLLFTHNFLAYLIIQIAFTVLNNLVMSLKANKMYPFLKGKATPLSKEESLGIFKNVKALTIYKFASVILNGTDNILVSAMFTVGDVGLVSNYVLITTTFSTLFSKITESFTASVGNLNIKHNVEKQYSVFNKIFFIGAWMFGFATIGMLLLVNDVISIWIGNSYLLPFSVVFAICLHFYVNSIHFTAYTYRTTLGLFVQGQIAPAVAAVLNIILSIFLGKKMGLCGIFFATSISRFFTTGLVDPILIYRRVFQKNPVWYYVKYFMYIGLFTAIYFSLRFILSYIGIGGIGGLILKCAIVTIVFNGGMVLIFGRTKMFQELLSAVKYVLLRRRKNVSDNA